MRNFYWYDNVLWLDEDLDRKAPDKGDGKVSLFVAEGDRYIDGPIIYGDAKAAEAARARGLYGVRSKGGNCARCCGRARIMVSSSRSRSKGGR